MLTRSLVFITCNSYFFPVIDSIPDPLSLPNASLLSISGLGFEFSFMSIGFK